MCNCLKSVVTHGLQILVLPKEQEAFVIVSSRVVFSGIIDISMFVHSMTMLLNVCATCPLDENGFHGEASLPRM